MTSRVLSFLLLVCVAAAGCKREAPAPAASVPVLPFRVAEETTDITSPLRPDGTPDYLLAFNNLRSPDVTPENNAFVALLAVVGTDVLDPKVRDEMLRLIGAPASREGDPKWEDFDAFITRTKKDPPYEWRLQIDDANRTIWKAEALPVAAEYLASVDSQLTGVVKAMERPEFWVPRVSRERGLLTRALLPASVLRQVCSPLLARATLRLGKGDADGFIADVLAIRRISGMLGNSPMLVDMLAGADLQMRVNHILGLAIGGDQLRGEKRRELFRALTRTRRLPPTLSGVRAVERWLALEMPIRVAMGNQEELKALNAPAAWSEIDRARVDWDIVLSTVRTTTDGFMTAVQGMEISEMNMRSKEGFDRAWEWFVPAFGAAMRGQPLPIPQTSSLAPRVNESREDYSTRVGASFLELATLWNAHTAAGLMHREALLTDNLLYTLNKIAEVRDAAGKWPATIDAMPEAVKRGLMTDPFAADQGRISYVVTAQGACVYSVGRNGKDDKGNGGRSREKNDIVMGVPTSTQ